VGAAEKTEALTRVTRDETEHLPLGSSSTSHYRCCYEVRLKGSKAKNLLLLIPSNRKRLGSGKRGGALAEASALKVRIPRALLPTDGGAQKKTKRGGKEGDLSVLARDNLLSQGFETSHVVDVVEVNSRVMKIPRRL